MENHLSSETSPYLLQHVNNPVDWYGWNDVSLKKAKDENKPIFLSIGYSACHWCHVMAHESFENDDVAEAIYKVIKEENITTVVIGRPKSTLLKQLLGRNHFKNLLSKLENEDTDVVIVA